MLIRDPATDRSKPVVVVKLFREQMAFLVMLVPRNVAGVVSAAGK